MVSLSFYADPGLTIPLASLDMIFADDWSATSRDGVFYVGSPVSGKVFADKDDPGVGIITLSIADDVSGGAEPAMIKLAASAGGLASAVAGNPLALGAEITSEPAGAVAVHVRATPGALALGTYAGLSLAVSPVVEVDA